MPVYKINKGTKDGRCYCFRTLYTTNSGDRKQYKSKKYLTRKEAIEEESKFIISHDNYIKKIDTNDMTFKDLRKAYMDYQKDKVKMTTLETYKDRDKFFKPIDRIKVKELEINHYEYWKKCMYEYNISNGYRNYIYGFFKAILNYGMT